MIYRLDLDAEARVLISHMSPTTKRKIRESLRTIAHNPYEGKPLQDELAGLLSYRVGTFRIVYSIDKTHKTIRVIVIGPRRSIYAELEREVMSKRRA